MHQIQFCQNAQQFPVAFPSRPRRERNECRRKVQPRRPKQPDHLEKIGFRVALVQRAKNLIVHRLHGGRHNQAASAPQLR